jgi:hypothetical protein
MGRTQRMMGLTTNLNPKRLAKQGQPTDGCYSWKFSGERANLSSARRIREIGTPLSWHRATKSLAFDGSNRAPK